MDPIPQRGDYDLDDDGLIEIRALAQLNAVRWDPNGDGAPSSGNAADYGKAFRGHVTGMGCPTGGGCTGYELENDLDFDTDGDGSTWTGQNTSFAVDSGDAYHNGGSGWEPIGVATSSTAAEQFDATFDGNGHVVANLVVNRSRSYVGLFAALRSSSAEVRSLGLPNARVRGAASWAGALVGYSRGRVAAVWTSGAMQAGGAVGGLAGYVNGGTVVASYSTAAVECTGSSTQVGGGLVGENLGTMAASYSTGAVTGACPNKLGLADAGAGGTFTASYWDTTRSGIEDDSDANPPEGRTATQLRNPTGYSGIYADWDDQDVDGDNAVGVAADADDDAWDFGGAWDWPVLKFGGLDTARQRALQPNLAPTFTGTVPNKTFRNGFPIEPFQIPEATGGEVHTYSYSFNGRVGGLKFDTTGAGTPGRAGQRCSASDFPAGTAAVWATRPRVVCGTPMYLFGHLNSVVVTETIYAHDGDANRDDGDRGALPFTITVVRNVAAAITSTAPATLTEATLDGAELTVTLTRTTFESTATASHFTLNTDVVGLTVGALAPVSAGDTSATLTLAYDDTDFDTARTVGVTVGAAAHSLPGALTTATVAVATSLEANATPSALTLNEATGADTGTFDVALDSLPAATTTVTVASADTGAATVDKAALTFTTTDWNTAQTVTVTAQADDDANDEEVAVTLTEASVGVLATVTVTVDDDDLGTVLIDADPSTSGVDDPGPLLLAEGDTGAYTVRLSAQPSADATVAVASGDTGAVTVDLSSLTFTTTNWSAPQTVTATAVAEASDSVDESVLVSHEATGGGYGGTTSNLRVGVSDAQRTGTDFDVDEDGLIEVSTLAQLNAVRWDLDGDGAVSAGNQANYSGASGAFASASTGMGCPAVSNTATCTGYELTRDLDFDTDGDGSTHTGGTSDAQDTYHNGGSGWDPLGPSSTPSDNTHFNATFDGNGHSIHNLFVARSRNYGGLFGALRGSAVVRSLGLPNAYVNVGTQSSAAPLAGASWGRVEAVWATGSATGNTNVGGLLGQNLAGAVVVASYSKAATQCGAGAAAGLVGYNAGSIVASYAIGAVTGSCAATAKHGLADGPGTATASYWDTTTSVGTSDQGTGRTTAQLKTPTSATGIYAGWADLDVDGDGDPHESPWHFGASSHYPALSYRGADVVPQRGDYDLDDDGLIEIRTLAQLNAVRLDLDGDGTPASSAANYGKAFRNHATGMGCPTVGGCTGYELENDLDFDTDGDGSTHTNGAGDSGDAYYNSGNGWVPIPAQFTATFDGNGKVIANLFVSVTNGPGALFTDLRAGAVARALGLEDAWVSGASYGAPLAGRLWGRVAGVWASGTVSSSTAGGLVGAAEPGSVVVASYATAAVSCIGGSPSYRAGGLAAITYGSIAASYSTGTVTGGCGNKVAFAGTGGSGSIAASYWDVDRSNIADDSGGAAPEGVTSANLRQPTGYTGIYGTWDDRDVDGDNSVGAAADPDDDAWDFGGEFQWPVLKFGGHDVARQVALQPNVAPTFGAGSVTNRTYRKDHAIAPFLVPPASGGEGTPYTYSASGLPAGLSLGATNCASERQVCGTPTANTTGAATVTIHAHDGDTNLADGDRAALTFTITVVTPTATLAASNPTSLTEANLDGAEVTVTLADTAFASGVAQSSFTLVDNVPGLAIASLATVTAGDTTATLTLTYTGADFTAVRTLSASVAASAHDLPGAIASSAVNVTPTPEAVVSRTTLALEEDPTAGGGTNRNVGTYTVALAADPTTAAGGNCTVVVTATSGNADVSLDTDATPRTKALTFTQSNWNTAQTVTATAASDDDSQDDAATITHARTGSVCSGGFFGTPTLPSLTVNVNDDETAGIVLDANPTTANIDESGPLAVAELSTASNNSVSYTARLSAEPTADVTVSVTSGDTTALTVDKASLTFTSSNWNTRQTVTATAVQDGDTDGESVTITHAASTTAMSEYTNVQATITASLTDKDTPGFVFDADPSSPATDEAGPLELQELQSSTTNAADYTVRLASLPTQTVTATITSSDTSAVTVGQSTLTFTTTSWNTPQTVTLSAQQDDGGANESVTIAHSAATATSSEYTNVTSDFTATVDDDETPAITLSTTALTVPEGSSADYTVQLATEPEGGSVTVAITGAADGITTNPTSLTFTAANWNTARSVRVTAATDPNGENEQAMLTHASSGGEYDDATDVVLTATATDSDTPSLAVSTTTLTVNENGTNTYTIRLNTQPSATVTVTVGGASGTVTVDTASTSGNQNTLTFTNANWATAQTVTVAAGSDDNARDEEVSLTHAASGGDYASLAPASRPGVTVTVDDDETAGILLDADPNTANDQSGPLALNENPMATNNSVSYTVRLSSEPTQDATVTIASDDTTAVTVDDTDGDNNNGVQNTLTFTSTNWNTPQTVTLTAADDTDGTGESATITHTVTGPAEYASVQATITANTTDDDAPSFVFDADPDTANDQAGPLALEELQSSSTNSDDYTVRLSAEPTQTVTATIASGDTSSVTVGDTDTDTPGDQNTLTFTSANWNTPRTVTLSAQQDDNGFDETVTITHTAATTPSSEFNNVSGSFTASVTDDETPAITLSATMLTVPEENSRTYTVRLATEPVGGSVTVDITGAANRLSASPTRLVFTAGNWDTARTVTVAAANDSDGTNDMATFSHAASGADYGSVPAATLTATSTDNDTPSLNVSVTALTVNENSSGSYTIRLNTQPSATVTVTVSGASGAVTVDTAATSGNQNTLTFTNANWATAQTVTVAAGDDGNAQNEMVSLTHTATGGDYAGLALPSRPGVTVTVTDNDTAGILLDADPNTANDQAGPVLLNELSTATNNTHDYTARLSSEPTQTTTVTITSNLASVTVGDTDGDSLNGVQNTLTFTAANWNTPRTVTLTAAEDDNGVGESATITHTSSTTTQSEYANLSATLTANTTDDDTPSFVFDADPDTANDQAGPLALNELSTSSTNSDAYTVRLHTQPTQTVTATISSNTPSVTVGDTDGDSQNGVQNTLTFTATNWDTPQTVTLTAQQDDNGFDETATITHSAATTTNSEYRNVSGSFTASVTDDETPAIALSTNTLTVPEENSAAYTVQLATEPVGGSVTVDITGAANRLSASPTRLIFTTSNWDTARTVRITAANDQDGNNETVTFTHAASGADYGGVATAALVATSTDNDTPSLAVTPTTLEVDENSTGTYRVRLNTQPTATVTVTVSGASGAVTVDTSTTSGDQNTLTFTTTNWGTNQTVTVAAGDDGNATDETLTLSHAASGGDYGSLGASARPDVRLTVDDDDTAGILLDADPNAPNDQSGPIALAELSTASNNSASYTVRLSSEPTQTATVTITSGDTTAVTVDDTDTGNPGVQNTLTFTSANWNTPQTVTLTAAQDNDGVGENVTITHTASTATQSEYTNLQATITANTTDAQAPGFVFDADPSSPATNEAGPLQLAELSSSSTNTDDYTVRLTSQPTQTVTATITSSNTLAVVVDDTDTGNPGTQNTLTFTSSNWNTPQTVTLTAQQDDNGFDESVTIAHAAATTTNSEYRNVNGSFMATVTDDETPAITLSATTLSVQEQNSATYTVRLATEPVGGNVTVDVTGAADGLSASPTRLVFTAGNWNTERTVRITAANDQDGDSETVTFSHAASGADYGSVPAAEIVATSTDNDTPSLQVTPTTLEVDENASGRYRIRLNTQPTANVTVTVSGATGAVTVDTATTSGDQNTLTFTTTTWSAQQTVTVEAGDDGNAQNEMLTLTHTASGGGYGSLGAGARPSVQLTVDDDDTAGILVDADPNTANDQAGPVLVNELSTATNKTHDYTVRLSSEPTQDATVTITSNLASVTVGDTDGDSLNGVQNTLTFTSANWNTPRTVTLTAAEDDNGVGESATITHTATTTTQSEYTSLSATLTANTTDDDTPSFVFDADPDTANDQSGPLALNELSSSSTNSDDYTVRLYTQPTRTVTATITSNTPSVTVGDTDGDSLNGVQNTLTFTATNWDTPQTVTLTAQQDDNGFDETATITHRARTMPNSEYTNVNGTFTATTTDDETPAITLSTTTLTVPEQTTATYTVRLATEPVGGNATVDITGAADGLSASPTRLIFTAGNWDTQRTVRVTAANDLDGDSETVTFTHAASGADYGSVPTAALVATSMDNDTPRLNVTPTTLEVDENSSGRYRIRLNTQPSATVTVTVSGATGAVTVDTSTTSGDQNTLTFTTTTWSAQQTVTVSAADDGNAVNEMLTLAHAASGGDYGALGAGARPSVQLTVDDDDTAGILIDADPNTPNDQPGPLALNELSTASNNSVSYTVRLSSEPTQDATVTITSNDTAVTVGDTDGDSLNGVQNTLTFTSANWNTPRTVTLTAAEDDDGVGESATITHTSTTSSASEYTNLSATLTANTTDDDAPSFVFDADPDTANDQSGPLALDELSSSTANSDDYTVRLYTQPTRTVTATITSNTPSVTVDTAPASGDQNALTFTSTNWNTPQTVTLTAQQDDNGFDETATLTHRARTTPNSEYTNVNGTFTASVTDDETPAITLSASTLTVPEQNSATYTVQLATQPVGGNATVTITGAADGISANPTRLVFTSRNWNTPRQVRVSAANDNDSTNEVVTLSHAASGADYGSVPTAAIVVTATDDDTPSLNVSPTRLPVRENGSASYTLRLNTQPSAPVTVTVGGTTAEVTVDADPDTAGDQTAMTFDATNWNAARTVTVSAADDDDATDETVNLTHAATGGDYTGLALASRPGVEVPVDDDDTPALLIDADPDTAGDQPGPLALNELSSHVDNTKNYTVRLATRPTAQVEVAVSSGDRAVHVDTGATPRMRTLTFTTTNWATAQTVEAVAAVDADASDERVSISHAATGGDYEGVSAQLLATTLDDDEPAIVVAASALVGSGVAEGGEATYTVRLDTEPDGAARVSVSAEGAVSVDLDRNQAGAQPWLRFDATNWNTPRTALVLGLEDADAASGTATLRHAASGADYGRAAAVDVSFAVTDDDAPEVRSDASSVEANEGSTAAYSVTLATAPTGGTVEVTPTSSDEAVATVSPTTLRFTASNWHAPQRVTVRGVSDGAANITHAATGADYGSAPTPTVAATVRDEDAPGVRVEPTLLSLEEGGTAGYRVRLNTEPSGDVTVTATSGSSELTLQDGAQQVGTLALTFTTQNWNAERQVRAQSVVDDDVADETTTVTHAVAGYAGVSSAPTLAVEVEDDDAPGIAFDPAAGLSLTEGGAATGTYSAVLTARPSAAVTVAVSSDDAGLAFDTNPAPGAPGDQTALTFTTTNWNVPQTVAARAETDGDAATEEALLLHAASGGGYDGVTAEYDVQVSDADAAPAPARVQASSAGTTSLAVNWSASPGANGYWVQWRAAGGEWSLDRLVEVPGGASAGGGGTLRVATGALSARIDGLREGVVYEVRVLGLISGDPGDPSPTASATPRPQKPRRQQCPGDHGAAGDRPAGSRRPNGTRHLRPVPRPRRRPPDVLGRIDEPRGGDGNARRNHAAHLRRPPRQRPDRGHGGRPPRPRGPPGHPRRRHRHRLLHHPGPSPPKAARRS